MKFNTFFAACLIFAASSSVFADCGDTDVFNISSKIDSTMELSESKPSSVTFKDESDYDSGDAYIDLAWD